MAMVLNLHGVHSMNVIGCKSGFSSVERICCMINAHSRAYYIYRNIANYMPEYHILYFIEIYHTQYGSVCSYITAVVGHVLGTSGV